MDLVSQTSHLPGMLHSDYLSMSYVCLTSVHRDNFVHRGGGNPFSTFGLFFFVFIRQCSRNPALVQIWDWYLMVVCHAQPWFVRSVMSSSGYNYIQIYFREVLYLFNLLSFQHFQSLVKLCKTNVVSCIIKTFFICRPKQVTIQRSFVDVWLGFELELAVLVRC